LLASFVVVTDNDTKAIQDATGNDVVSITDQVVTNNTNNIVSLNYNTTSVSEAEAHNGSITAFITITLSNDIGGI
jgi:hypothetical protein